ncbi:MAG: HEAT repeat domain-containing protein [Steroidobacteraceae bacterium]
MPLRRKPPSAAPSSGQSPADALRALGSTDADERWAAARAAASAPGGPAAMAAALRLESEPHVREALFTSLARADTAQSAAELLSLLRSDQATLRIGALDALRAMGEAIRDVLPRFLGDSDVDIRILSCELARALPAEEATAALCALLAREADVNVCAAAIDVLAEVGSPAAVPVLAQCAARFAQNSFLGFAAKIATDRISSQNPPPRD